MLDPHKDLSDILENPHFDTLVKKARAQAEKLSGATIPQADELNSQVDEIKVKSAEARREMVAELQERQELRQEKAAIAVHMVRVATRLTNG